MQIGGGDPGSLGILRRQGDFVDGDVAGREGCEEIALAGVDAVEADEADLRWESEIVGGGEQRSKLRRAEPTLVGADAFEGGGPVAEALGVGGVGCGAPRGAACGVRVVAGKQVPGVHGEGGHRVFGENDEVIVALDAGPESLLLQGREEHGGAGVGEGVVAVEIAEERIPVVDGGRGPDGVAGGALGCGELELEGSGGAGIGGNDGGSALERDRDRAVAPGHVGNRRGEAHEGLQIEV